MSMKSKMLAIIGASGHGKVIADAALKSGDWESVIFYDDRYPELNNNETYKVIGTVSELLATKQFTNVVIAVGDNKTRVSLHKKFKENNFLLPNIIHPSAIIADNVQIGEGTVIFAGVVINSGSRIGATCIVNTSSIVEHDCMLQDGVHISPGASIAGGVKIGKGSWVGIGSSVIQLINIGSNAIIGAGSAVIRDVADDTTVIGVPAKQI